MTDAEKIAILKAATWHKEPEAPEETAVRGAFNPKLFTTDVSVAVNAGRFLQADDGPNHSQSTSIGVASDLLNCAISGQEGTSECNHRGGDHVDMARQCLDRAKHLDGAANVMQSSRVQFVN